MGTKVRTFVFGAGASIHAGYPLASKLWTALQQWEREQAFAPLDYCCGAVNSVNEAFDISLPFELMLTDLDKRIQSPRNLFEKACFPVLRGQIQQLVCRFFDSIRSDYAKLYRTFAREVLAPGDAVITFNYDLSLDREMQDCGMWTALDGYGFPLERSTRQHSSCKLLKLHGSTNWIGQIFDGLAPGGFSVGSFNTPSVGLRPAIPTTDLNYLGANLVDPEFRGTGGFVPSLIMPAAEKKFYTETSINPREWEDFWNSLWSQAEDSIAGSDEVHIIGYSLPEYDRRANDLLLKTRRLGVLSICCRSDTARLVERFQKFGFQNARQGGDGSFESWLEVNAKTSIS
jgi:hypothetical protein